MKPVTVTSATYAAVVLGTFGTVAALCCMASAGEMGLQPVQDWIQVRNPKQLPPKIPCERIALGRKGDYKPCIAKLPSGELLVVAFDASHRPVDGGIREDMLLWRSRDGGRTWSKRQVLPLLGREPYFSVLGDGTLLITTHFLKQDVRNKEGYVYSLLHRSTDGGRTWHSMKIGWEDVPGAAKKATIVTSRNVLELRDGTVILGVAASKGVAYLWRSRDRGRTWDKSLACRFAGVDTNRLWWPIMGETVFWEARNGDLLGLFRTKSCSRRSPARRFRKRSWISTNGWSSSVHIMAAATGGWKSWAATTARCIRRFCVCGTADY
ncbi:MAG: exo-alpha-sialidase [Planctomycetes bacterium]|nr:exo-alpha-sialidase [Planctomycetota bacterium]